MSKTAVPPDASVVIVSYNTRDLLAECLVSLKQNAGGISYEVLVVDNASRDGSADFIEKQFPATVVVRSEVNLGFAAANNRALPLARGRYIVLLNSDAFLQNGALELAVSHMDREKGAGIGGARLVGRDGSWQPSARMFPSLLNDFLSMTGLAAKFPASRFFGRMDRTWADPSRPAEVDWVPGAFSIIRRQALEQAGCFDESFFLYYEEVDLCRRIKAAGYSAWYWSDVVVVHLGGESSKTVQNLALSSSGSQLTLWRMRSALLYYRKHHGGGAWMEEQMEVLWHLVRHWKNRLKGDARKAEESKLLVSLMRRAWRETSGGRVSPPRPW
ncbi:MAG: glycosyltransferase family 2 protein [Acidobacteria bacterium]|nr:glycosyltransferase family 2 protein [Acidobacteriota bacterium]